MSKIDELKALKASYYDAIKTAGKDAVKEFFTPIFEAIPSIESFRWTQYAPYFNDGEPCTFRVHELTFKPACAEDDEDSDYREGYLGVWGIKYYAEDHPELQAIIEPLAQISKAFQGIPADLLEFAFGGDSQVTVSRTSIDVEDYGGEHD